MRIFKITAFTLLALSLHSIAIANEVTNNVTKENSLQKKDLITRLKQAKKQSAKKSSANYIEINSIDSSSSTEFSEISTQAKDLQIQENFYPVQNSPIITSSFEQSKKQNEIITKNDLLIQNRQPVFTTAHQLKRGEIVTNLGYRHFLQSGSAETDGLTGQPTIGITWGVTDDLELTFDTQTVDNAGPVRQGSFNAQRINPTGFGPNFFQEWTLQAKNRIWQNKKGTQALSGVVAASVGNADRPYRFFNGNANNSNGLNSEIVTSLELPFTVKLNTLLA